MHFKKTIPPRKRPGDYENMEHIEYSYIDSGIYIGKINFEFYLAVSP